MLTINTKEIRELEDWLHTFADRALPFATKATVNSSAFFAMRAARGIVKRTMITRNRWTVASVRVNPTSSLTPRNQIAAVGSTAPYMATQEFGGTETKKGKVGLAIATSVASGEGEGVQPRKRLPRKANKMRNIRLERQRVAAANRKQRNLIAIKEAQASGRKFVYLNLGRRQGIFRIARGKLRMIHDLSHDSVTIPKHPWLKPAVERTRPEIPVLYHEALTFQVKRLGLFKRR